MIASIQTLGDWDSKVGVGLASALRASVELCGRSGEQACRHALILMVQSARRMTPQSRRTRPVLNETQQGLGQYVEVFNQGDSRPTRVFKFQFSKTLLAEDQARRPPGEWECYKRIGFFGLAKRSWLWGMHRLGMQANGGREMRGVSRVYAIKKPNVAGYVKQSRLSYLMRIMPAGWEASVSRLAANKIMAQARDKLQRQWQRAMGDTSAGLRRGAISNSELARFFEARMR